MVVSVAESTTQNGNGRLSTGAASKRNFTQQQKRMVLKNWKVLSNDLTGRGSRIFIRIFQLNPNVKMLFPCHNLEGEDLLRDHNFKGHASRFMQAVGAVIDNIDSFEESLSPLLNGLGRQHIHFRGFQPDYFNVFEQAIMDVWAEDLGPKFGDQSREAWHTVFTFLMRELKQGFEDALSDAGLTKPPWVEEEEVNKRRDLYADPTPAESDVADFEKDGLDSSTCSNGGPFTLPVPVV